MDHHRDDLAPFTGGGYDLHAEDIPLAFLRSTDEGDVPQINLHIRRNRDLRERDHAQDAPPTGSDGDALIPWAFHILATRPITIILDTNPPHETTHQKNERRGKLYRISIGVGSLARLHARFRMLCFALCAPERERERRRVSPPRRVPSMHPITHTPTPEISGYFKLFLKK